MAAVPSTGRASGHAIALRDNWAADSGLERALALLAGRRQNLAGGDFRPPLYSSARRDPFFWRVECVAVPFGNRRLGWRSSLRSCGTLFPMASGRPIVVVPGARTWTVCCLAAVCLLQTGCVQRRFTIRSNPPGALVYVNNHEIGTTPVSHDFIYYGTREIRLVKDGYETQTVMAKMPAPWYDLPGIDFISENLVPNEIHDHRVLDFQLQPQVIVPTDPADRSRRRTAAQPQRPIGRRANGR